MLRSDLTQVKFLRVEYDKAMEPIDKSNDEHVLTDYEGDSLFGRLSNQQLGKISSVELYHRKKMD